MSAAQTSQNMPAEAAQLSGTQCATQLLLFLGEDGAAQMLRQLDPAGILSTPGTGAESRALEALRWMEPRVIAGLIENEHPQIQAVVISYLPAGLAADVLAGLVEDNRTEILVRMASLEPVDPRALRALNASVGQQVASVLAGQHSADRGVRAVANILNGMDREAQHRAMEQMREADGELASRVQAQRSTFEDLPG